MIPELIKQYNSETVYKNGSCVLSPDGEVWRAKWYTQGVAPSNAADVWELLGDMPVIGADAALWLPQQTYTRGNIVKYGGYIFMAKWWTLGEIPTNSGEYDVWVALLLAPGGTTAPSGEIPAAIPYIAYHSPRR
jgi:chitodextrinase